MWLGRFGVPRKTIIKYPFHVFNMYHDGYQVLMLLLAHLDGRLYSSLDRENSLHMNEVHSSVLDY